MPGIAPPCCAIVELLGINGATVLEPGKRKFGRVGIATSGPASGPAAASKPLRSQLYTPQGSDQDAGQLPDLASMALQSKLLCKRCKLASAGPR